MEKKKILLIDDDIIQHNIAQNMLSDEYEVFSAKSGKDGLHLLYSSDFLPNLILLDILMPEMDGWEVYNRIKAVSFLKNIPIVFVTSLNETEEKQRALDMGATDFIIKPYERENVLSRIKEIIYK